MMRNEQTKQWICQCKVENPLRLHRCQNCGLGVPNRVLEQIYREELRIQRSAYKLEQYELAQHRWQKVGQVLKRRQRMLVPTMVLLFVLTFGSRYYLFSQNIHNGVERYCLTKQENIYEVCMNHGELLSHLNRVPETMYQVWNRANDRLRDTKENATTICDDGTKHIRQEKVIKIQEKRRMVVEYVTNYLK